MLELTEFRTRGKEDIQRRGKIKGENLMYFKVNSPKVKHEAFEDGELVVIHFEKGIYSSANKAGNEIWQMIERGFGTDEIQEGLCRRYPGASRETVGSSVKAFIVSLEKEELVLPVPDGKRPGVLMEQDGEVCAGEFEIPVLNKYTDMQEMLLLDPIHEVDEQGWPNIKPPIPNG